MADVLEELKKGFLHSNVFKPKELEDYELVNIIVSMSVLRINDKPFLTGVLKFLDMKLEHLGPT